MNASRDAARPTVAMRLRRGWARLSRRAERAESGELFLLVALTLALGAGLAIWPEFLPLSLLVVPLVLGSLVLGPRQLPRLVVLVLVSLALVLMRQGEELTTRVAVGVVVVFLLGFIILLTSFRRSRLGVGGARGESMLVDLRDRIQSQAKLPELPNGWYAQAALRSAGGTPFAGDFLVASRPGAGERLDVVVVDVSGKGAQAGTRALLLSGAFGGLLTALDPREFLPAANDYLLRQDWDEGFATAVHLSLDLATGDFVIRTAGHPPAVQLVSGSGRWTMHETEGPVLGLIPGAEFPGISGTMRSGDVILLYTDGMVETADRDIALGIDKLLGHAERLLHGDFEWGAGRLVDAVGSHNDDRALVLVHRK